MTRAIFDGWQISGITRFQSGAPYSLGFNIPNIGSQNITGSNTVFLREPGLTNLSSRQAPLPKEHVLCAAISFAALRSWSRSFERRVMETKSVRELTGIVKSKGYRKFTKVNANRVENNQYFYTDDEGHLVQRYPGDEDWLIYYEVEYFSHRDEPMSGRLMTNEKKRVAAGKLRTAIIAKELYDQINVGDRISANYQ